jgi:hypothetical protein
MQKDLASVDSIHESHPDTTTALTTTHSSRKQVKNGKFSQSGCKNVRRLRGAKIAGL